MAIAMVAGFVLASRLALRAGGPAAAGMMGFLLVGPLVVVLAGSAAAAAAGRSFRSGLWACAWATVLGAAAGSARARRRRARAQAGLVSAPRTASGGEV